MSNQESSSGLQNNVAGVLSYFFIPAIIFLIQEPFKSNRFIRFHAFQGLFLGGISLAFSFVVSILAQIMTFMVALMMPIIGLINLCIFIAAVICAVKAFNNETFKLPVLGDLAEKQAAS